MEVSLIHILFVFSALLLIVFIYLLRWRDYRLPLRWKRSEQDGMPMPAVSIVIPAHNQAPQLEENLPYFMSQQFETFEIIVVDIHSSDTTTEVLKHLENPNVILRCVKLPATSRYIGKNRLAMSLGIRAAHFPWVVFSQPDCRPKSNLWLSAMASEMTEQRNIVLGYANYEDERKRGVRRAIYERMRCMFRNLRALRRGGALSADVCNLAVRKSFYMEEHPLSGKLTMPFGEAALLADTYGKKAQTAFTVSPDATILQYAPHRGTLASQRMYAVETGRHLSFRSWLYRLRESLASWCAYFIIAVFVSYVSFRVFEYISSQGYSTEMLFYDIPMFVLMVVALCLPLLLLRRTCRFLSVRPMGLRPLWYGLSQPFRILAAKFSRWRHRKEFVRPIIPSAEYK